MAKCRNIIFLWLITSILFQCCCFIVEGRSLENPEELSATSPEIDTTTASLDPIAIQESDAADVSDINHDNSSVSTTKEIETFSIAEIEKNSTALDDTSKDTESPSNEDSTTTALPEINNSAEKPTTSTELITEIKSPSDTEKDIKDEEKNIDTDSSKEAELLNVTNSLITNDKENTMIHNITIQASDDTTDTSQNSTSLFDLPENEVTGNNSSSDAIAKDDIQKESDGDQHSSPECTQSNDIPEKTTETFEAANALGLPKNSVVGVVIAGLIGAAVLATIIVHLVKRAKRAKDKDRMLRLSSLHDSDFED